MTLILKLEIIPCAPPTLITQVKGELNHRYELQDLTKIQGLTPTLHGLQKATKLVVGGHGGEVASHTACGLTQFPAVPHDQDSKQPVALVALRPVGMAIRILICS